MLKRQAFQHPDCMAALGGQMGVNMNINVVLKTARSVTFELKDGGKYFAKSTYEIRLNGEKVKETDKVVTSLFGLKPKTSYRLEVCQRDGLCLGELSFETEYEYVTLDVRAFGAKGDGIQNDTPYIQAAIMACPHNSRVLITKGTYLISSLFLKSNIQIEITKDAVLLANPDRYSYPKLPGLTESYDEKEEYFLGTWEGNPLPMFSGIITGIDVENVVLYGEGTIHGNASTDNWWKHPKIMEGAFRPRMLFLNRCKQISLQGLLFQDSPSWTLHPYFSEDLKFVELHIRNPKDSPNTDGLNPESCKNVHILGVEFSLGDDCIAVKSGKIYMGSKYKIPSENIYVRQCLMENGHGAVTIGSEMAGGVKHLIVEECVFRNTDRGLRIKTRRGRGKDAVIDHIVFRNLEMDHVMSPFVVNSFYFCDPDGKTEYVQSRDYYPVDDRTPCIKRLEFQNIAASNCHVAAAYIEGLPEEKIKEIVMKNITISYAEHPRADVPAMSLGVEPCSKKGIYARNVERIILENITVLEPDGKLFDLQQVSEVIES